MKMFNERGGSEWQRSSRSAKNSGFKILYVPLKKRCKYGDSAMATLRMATTRKRPQLRRLQRMCGAREGASHSAGSTDSLGCAGVLLLYVLYVIHKVARGRRGVGSLDGKYVFSVSRTGLETDCFFLFLEAACLFSSVLFCFVSRTGPETDCFFLFLAAPSLFYSVFII